jgi:hypothetical protein
MKTLTSGKLVVGAIALALGLSASNASASGLWFYKTLDPAHMGTADPTT